MSLFLGFRGLLRRSALAKCPDTVGRVLWGERRNKLSVAWGGGGRSTAPCKVSPVAGLVSTRCPSSTCTPCTMGMERRLRKERGFNETHSTHPTHCQHVGPDRPGGGGECWGDVDQRATLGEVHSTSLGDTSRVKSYFLESVILD